MPTRNTNNQREIGEIILTPELDINATSFDVQNLVHQLEYDQVKEIICKLKKTGENYNPQKKEYFKRVHNTITLSGSRGSGKTSFLYTLKNDISISNETLILDIIDPTLIEEKGHVFLNIVARIKEVVDEKREVKRDEICEDYESWCEILKKLAAGLPMLDGISGSLDPSDWNDTTFVMMDGLRKVCGANNLEFYFHQYIYYSLKILDKNYLIIAFDDVDTDFSKGWPVLETLRKYLTSPQLITLLSGDLDLYSFLVRKKQWKNFGKALLKNEYDKELQENVSYLNAYPELVEKLESQYMMKLLKPEYRIILSTIASKLKSNQVAVFVKCDDEINEIKLCYDTYLEKTWGVKGENTTNTYVKFFTSMTLRTQLSLLNAFSIVNNERLSMVDKLHRMSKSMSDIFYSELHSTNVEVWEMLNGYGLANIYMLKFLLQNKVLDEASQFFPKLNNPSLDSAVLAMGAVLSEKISTDSYEIFDFITRVSNIVTKANWVYDSDDKQVQNIEDFVVHSHSLYDYGLKKIASLQSAYIVSFKDYEAKNEGLIPIKTLQAINKGRRDENDLRVDELFDDSNKICQILAVLPAFGAQDKLGENATFYSFYNILASIGDLVLQNEKEILNEFVRLGQFREFPLFTNSNESFFNERENNEDVEIFFKNDERNSIIISFIQEIAEWKKTWVESSTLLPPYLLSRILVRTAYSFRNINSQLHVGNLLHRQLIVFLNAVLVEEVMENVGNSALRLNNPSNSDAYFVENIKKTESKKGEKSMHSLFDFIFSCPIIRAYLDKSIFDSIGSEKPNVNISSRLAILNIKDVLVRENRNTDNLVFVKKVRTVSDTYNDAELIVQYLKSKGKQKESITYWDVDRAIRFLFANKKVYTATANKLLIRVQNSDKW